MSSPLSIFLSGLSMALYVIAALFFARFWERTKDRLFAGFASAFLLLACERVALLATYHIDETRTWVYLIRLLAFAVLIWVIVDKNRGTSRR